MPLLQDYAIGILDLVQDLGQDRGRFRSVLNGLIGDTLEACNSPMAISMGVSGELTGKKVCVLVHGLFDTARTWEFIKKPAQDYGSMLKRDLGYSPLYVTYNTGLHISTNGRLLSKQLTRLFNKNDNNIREIIFIGHSMGGLVIRSACHYGRKERAPWIDRVKKIFFLCTPHLGSDWEKLGHLTTIVLKLIPNFFTMGIAALGNRRSAGIKDLRFGYLLDEDWKTLRENALWHDNRHPVPLLPGVQYYNIASILAKEASTLISEYFGDGLVHMRSAAGRSFFRSKTLPFTQEHFKVFRGYSHARVTRDTKVYQQIIKWCRADEGRCGSKVKTTALPTVQ